MHENKLIGLDVDTTVNIFLCSESEDESADDGHVSEEEVTQTIIDEDGQEKTVTVMVQKPPKPKKRQSELTDQDGNDKDGEEKKKRKDKDKSRHKDKDSSREKDGKHSKHEKEGDEKDHKKKKRDKDRSGSYGGDSVYGKKDDKKKERRMTMDGLSEAPELININRRLEAAETGIKGLRNIIDSMVNQVDFGDEVGGMLKAQLDQVQQQLNKVELVPEGEAAKKEKKRKGSKAKGPQDMPQDMPQDGIITEGSQQGPGAVEGQGQSMKVVPVIPPPDRMSQDMPKLQPGRLPSRKDEKRKISLPMRGERPPSQGEKAPLRKRTTMEDLKLRKKAREEGVTIEEIEARETAQESKKEKKSKEKEKEKGKEDEKEKADKKKGEESSSDEESIDSEEEREAMEEMIMEEIEAALENTDDPEAQAYALRLSIEQMNNMKRNFAQSQEEFKKEMEKNKRAIELIAKDLAAFRSARKAQVSS